MVAAFCPAFDTLRLTDGNLPFPASVIMVRLPEQI
jgi:hypothetical protein